MRQCLKACNIIFFDIIFIAFISIALLILALSNLAFTLLKILFLFLIVIVFILRHVNGKITHSKVIENETVSQSLQHHIF